MGTHVCTCVFPVQVRTDWQIFWEGFGEDFGEDFLEDFLSLSLQSPCQKSSKNPFQNPHIKICMKNPRALNIRTDTNIHTVGMLREAFLTTSPNSRLDHDPG